jgi:hypothetical protein
METTLMNVRPIVGHCDGISHRKALGWRHAHGTMAQMNMK